LTVPGEAPIAAEHLELRSGLVAQHLVHRAGLPPTLMAMPAPPVTKASPILTPVSPTALALATRVSSAFKGSKVV
jgi:hypothetical protein